MDIRARLSILAALVVLGWVDPAAAQKRDKPSENGPALAPAPQAPGALDDDESVVFWGYRNQMGTFTLNMKAKAGTAKYKWFDGATFNDELRYSKLISIREPEDPSGLTRCTLWEVPGEDFKIAFGTNGFMTSDRPNQVLYRMYYTWDGKKFYRWKTNSGTSRAIIEIK